MNIKKMDDESLKDILNLGYIEISMGKVSNICYNTYNGCSIWF